MSTSVRGKVVVVRRALIGLSAESTGRAQIELQALIAECDELLGRLDTLTLTSGVDAALLLPPYGEIH